MKDTIQLVTWKGTVKKYGYKESKNKGTRFGIELRLDGEDDVRFIWCDTNLQRKTIVKRMMSIGAAEDRPFNLID
mgnify:CR=1 FL=1|jgi:hypothetical protein|tara:strand:- start:116 stop:340 length:225 start_codon:yes stop_codon:yes gene_type:complete